MKFKIASKTGLDYKPAQVSENLLVSAQNTKTENIGENGGIPNIINHYINVTDHTGDLSLAFDSLVGEQIRKIRAQTKGTRTYTFKQYKTLVLKVLELRIGYLAYSKDVQALDNGFTEAISSTPNLVGYRQAIQGKRGEISRYLDVYLSAGELAQTKATLDKIAINLDQLNVLSPMMVTLIDELIGTWFKASKDTSQFALIRYTHDRISNVCRPGEPLWVPTILSETVKLLNDPATAQLLADVVHFTPKAPVERLHNKIGRVQPVYDSDIMLMIANQSYINPKSGSGSVIGAVSASTNTTHFKNVKVYFDKNGTSEDMRKWLFFTEFGKSGQINNLPIYVHASAIAGTDEVGSFTMVVAGADQFNGTSADEWNAVIMAMKCGNQRQEMEGAFPISDLNIVPNDAYHSDMLGEINMDTIQYDSTFALFTYDLVNTSGMKTSRDRKSFKREKKYHKPEKDEK